MIPIWQIMLGVCVGVVAVMLTRPPINGPHEESRSRRGRQRKQTEYFAEPGENCVICLEEMSNNDMIYMPCGHALHERCAKELKRRYTNIICPTCKSPI